MYYNASLEGPRCDLCSNSGDSSSEVACTGITGNTYTPAKCEGGDASADPYTADANGNACTTQSGTYTAASCTNGGDASSEAACEGTSTGNTFSFGGGDSTSGPSGCFGTYFNSQRGVDLAKIFVSDVTGFKNISLVGARVSPVTNATVDIFMTEQQRVNAIELSGTPGGDLKAIFLDIDAGAFQDLSSNGIAQVYNVTVAETLDYLIPIMQPATLEYGPGILHIVAQEFIDASSVNVSKIFISDVSGQRDIQLTGATLKEGTIDGFEIEIVLTEAQRAAAISISGLPGGNQHSNDNNNLNPVVIDFDLDHYRHCPIFQCRAARHILHQCRT